MMAAVWIFLFLIYITPLKMGVAVHWQSSQPVRIALGVTVWGVRIKREYAWPARLIGENAIKTDSTSAVSSFDGIKKRGRLILHFLWNILRSDHVRNWLMVEHVHVRVAIGFLEAAGCALMDALLKIVFALVRHMPGCDFKSCARFDGQSAVQGLCIVRLRLGNLLVASALGAAAYWVAGRKKKEEKKWSTIPLKI